MEKAGEQLGYNDDGYSLNTSNCQHFVCMIRNRFEESYEANDMRKVAAAIAAIAVPVGSTISSR